MRSLIFVATLGILASAVTDWVASGRAQPAPSPKGKVTKAMFMVTGLH